MSYPAVPPPPRSATGRRSAVRPVLGVVLLVVLLVVFLFLLALLRGGDDRAEVPPPEARVEEPGPDEEETPPPPAEPEPAEPVEPDDPGTVDGLVGQITEQVGELRGLPAEEAVEAEVLDPDELAATISDLIARDQDPEELERRRRVLVALRLIPDDLELAAFLEELLGEQVAGLYAPEDGRLYVRSDGPAELTPGEEVTLAHEVAHALQDRAFDLEGFLDMSEEDPDAQLAAQALVEGDAVLTQELWSLAHQSAEQRRSRLEDLGELDTETLERAPRYLREMLLFPYQEGTEFVNALYQRGGFDAIDAAFAEPPTTTAQVLDVEVYDDRPEPVAVDTAASPGTDWTPVGSYTVGAFDLRSLLRAVDTDVADQAAAGWAGGRLAAWERDDEVAVSLTLAFTGGEAASVVCTALPFWYTEVAEATTTGQRGLLAGDRDWAAVDCDDDQVRLGLGPDEDKAAALAGR